MTQIERLRRMIIDSGTSRVSSYWGYNAPKLVYDGKTFYSPGYWGENPSASQLRTSSSRTCSGCAVDVVDAR